MPTIKETKKRKRPLVLLIMDGYGIRESAKGNAIAAARKPVLDRLMAECPHALMRTSGMDVGLPEGQMGNSEVGHTNMGAGRIVYQELTRITKSIRDDDFFQKEELADAVDHCRRHGSKLHLLGLLSDGGVHSHDTHLYALVELAARRGLGKEDVFIHAFMDGRDVPPDSGAGFIARLEEKLAAIGVGRIATVMGRYYAMDRDNRWERVSKAYTAMTEGIGLKAGSAGEAVDRSYRAGDTDEFVKPSVVTGADGKPVATIDSGDAVIFFNFRPDRAREITRAFVDEEFSGFERRKICHPLKYVCMTQYDVTIRNVTIAFKPESLANTFGEYISRKGLTQLRIAETEKYAHVTFFFNGGVETACAGEDRALIPSPKVPTYDLKPAMSAVEVTDEVVTRIASGKYDVIILNYANPDMVGHTGVFDAAVKAIETVDTCVGRVADAVSAAGGRMLITADHGNAECMIDEDQGGPMTAHTTNPTPLILVGQPGAVLREGRLADIAPTMLKLLGLEKPAEMTGESLVAAPQP